VSPGRTNESIEYCLSAPVIRDRRGMAALVASARRDHLLQSFYDSREIASPRCPTYPGVTDHRATGRTRATGLPNPLPTELAFVVQFGAAPGPTDEITAGRIEHVVSGRQRRFADAAELLAALREMLTAAALQPHGKERTR